MLFSLFIHFVYSNSTQMLPNTLIADTLLLHTCSYVIGASDFTLLLRELIH